MDGEVAGSGPATASNFRVFSWAGFHLSPEAAWRRRRSPPIGQREALFTAVKLAPPGNCRAALSHKTARMSPAAGATALVQRREGGGNHQHVLLHEGLARLPTLRRPDAFLAGLFSDREALGRVLVRPDVAPTVEAAEFRVPSEGQWRELHAVGDRCAPAIDDAGDAA